VPATLISPASSVNCSQGLASDRSQRQGFSPAVILALLARRKQGQNDVPQLPFSDGQSRILRHQESPTLEVPAVRQTTQQSSAAPVQY